MTSRPERDPFAEWGLRLVIALGIVVRLHHYLVDRSLWLDEAMISLNIDLRSFAELAGSLDFNQAAPLGFLWLEKLAVSVLGTSELALRLWPLIAGVGALLLFAGAAWRLLSPRAAVFVVGLFAISTSLTYFAAEVKQYSFDVLFACAVLWLAAAVRHETRGSLVILAVFGAIGVWFSHPFVFLLPGIALFLWLADAPELRVDRERTRTLVLVGLVWGVSFAAAYLLTARDASRSPLMARFWAEGFMPIPPTSADELRWYVEAFSGWVRNVFDFTETDSPARAVVIWVGGLLALIGIPAGWSHRRRALVLVLSPVLLALIASAVGVYPFKGRLILFLVPSTLVLLGWGVETTIFGSTRPGDASAGGELSGGRGLLQAIGGLAAAILLMGAGAILVEWIQRPEREELRPVIEYVATQVRPGDVIYLHSGAQHAYLFYERTCEPCRISGATVVRGRFQSGSDEAIAGDIAALPATGRVWLLFAHEWWGYGDVERLRMTRLLASRTASGEPSDVREETGASAYLFELAGP